MSWKLIAPRHLRTGQNPALASVSVLHVGTTCARPALAGSRMAATEGGASAITVSKTANANRGDSWLIPAIAPCYAAQMAHSELVQSLLRARLDELRQETELIIAELESPRPTRRINGEAKPRRQMSAAARKAVSARMRKYWRERRKANQ